MSQLAKRFRTSVRTEMDAYHDDLKEQERVRTLRQAEALRRNEDIEDAWNYWNDPCRDWDDWDYEYDHDCRDQYVESEVHPTESEWRAVVEMDWQIAHKHMEEFQRERMENLSSAPCSPEELVAVLRAVCVLCEESNRYGQTILDTNRFTVLADELVQKLLVSLGYEKVVDYINSQKSRRPW